MSSAYPETSKNVYKAAAENQQIGLCCTTIPIRQVPGLDMPVRMQRMNLDAEVPFIQDISQRIQGYCMLAADAVNLNLT